MVFYLKNNCFHNENSHLVANFSMKIIDKCPLENTSWWLYDVTNDRGYTMAVRFFPEDFKTPYRFRKRMIMLGNYMIFQEPKEMKLLIEFILSGTNPRGLIDFSDALRLIKSGKTVMRIGWHGSKSLSSEKFTKINARKKNETMSRLHFKRLNNSELIKQLSDEDIFSEDWIQL